MDLNAAALTAINTAISTSFNTSLTGVETTYGRIAMTVPSMTAANVYPKLSEIPAMREWVGERHIHRLMADGFTIKNRKFENTIAVQRDDIADDQYGMYATLASDFGQTAAELPDDLVWEQLAAGFDTTHYDGQNFFDTDHPVEDENGVVQSVSNFGGGTGTAWYLIDTSRVIKPIIFQDREAAEITAKTNLTDPNVFNLDEFLWGARRRCAAGFGAWQLAYASKQTLNGANYEAARTAMHEMRGHRGRKLNLRPNLLVVPPSLEGAARDLLEMRTVSTGGDNKWFNSARMHMETRLA